MLLRAAKTRAKKHGLVFDLDLSDISIPEKCPVLGIPLFRIGAKQSPNSPSIDRVDPLKGYVKSNVQVISWRANKLKSDASVDEIQKIAEWVRLSRI